MIYLFALPLVCHLCYNISPPANRLQESVEKKALKEGGFLISPNYFLLFFWMAKAQCKRWVLNFIDQRL